jgi:hypothetical protein
MWIVSDSERPSILCRDVPLLPQRSRAPLSACFAILLAMFLPSSCLASSCAKLIPPNGAYDILRTSSNEELHEQFDDYLYKKNYGTEDEAIKDGFSVGFPMYGQYLKAGNDFDQVKKKAWFDEYESRTKRKRDSSKAAAFESMTLNVQAMKVVSHCIEATEGFGIVSDLEPTSDCTATFTARYQGSRDNEPPLKVSKPPLRVQGAPCDKWPKTTIGSAPTTVNCSRSGRDALVVTLNTLDGPSAHEHMDALPQLGTEPAGHDKFADTFTKPATKDFSLYHRNFTKWDGPDTDLGDYRFTFYSDIPAPSGGKIESAELLSCVGCGAHFWLCPNNHLCPHPLFDTIDSGGGFLGLMGLIHLITGSTTSEAPYQSSSLRVWGYRDSTDPQITVNIRLHYFDHETTCIDQCGQDLARAKWLAENARTCPAIRGAVAVKGLQ